MPVKIVIEMIKGSNLKYEYCEESKMLVLDRVISTKIPFYYGYVADTLAQDGDTLDVVLMTDVDIQHSPITIIDNLEYVDLLEMEDEKGIDNKLIVSYNNYKVSFQDRKNIKKFFKTYKNTTKVGEYKGDVGAWEELKKCIMRKGLQDGQ